MGSPELRSLAEIAAAEYWPIPPELIDKAIRVLKEIADDPAKSPRDRRRARRTLAGIDRTAEQHERLKARLAELERRAAQGD